MSGVVVSGPDGMKEALPNAPPPIRVKQPTIVLIPLNIRPNCKVVCVLEREISIGLFSFCSRLVIDLIVEGADSALRFS